MWSKHWKLFFLLYACETVVVYRIKNLLQVNNFVLIKHAWNVAIPLILCSCPLWMAAPNCLVFRVRVRVRVTLRLTVTSSWRQAPSDPQPIFFQLNTCGCSPYVTSSLTRGLVCRLQLLLGLASAVILRSESRGIHDHILLSQIRDSPNLEGQVPVFISPRNRVAQLYPQALGSLRLAGLPRLHTRYSLPSFSSVFLITPLHGPSRKHRFQQYFYCCMRIRCRGNVFTEPLFRNGSTLYSVFNVSHFHYKALLKVTA
jgi:hypothetical protein